jgi:hypothetical protein
MTDTSYLIGAVPLTTVYLIGVGHQVRKEFREGNMRGRRALSFTILGMMAGTFLQWILRAL